jgi:excisionase family DNA binding protein
VSTEQQSIQSNDLLTVAEAAQFLRCTVHTIYSLTRARAGSNALPRIAFGKSLLFLRSDLTNYLLTRRTTEAPKPRPHPKGAR